MIDLTSPALSATFSALADPTRRQILAKLSEGTRSVGELAEPLEMSLPAVSKHLRILEEAGLLDRRQEGRRHLLTLNAEPMKDAREWMDFYREFWESNLDALAAWLEDGKSRKKSNPGES